MEQLELPCCTNKSVKWYNCFGKLVGNFLRVKHVSRKFFSQDRVTGTEITLQLGTTKNLDEIYETAVFKILDGRQERTVSLERQETNEVSPSLVPGESFQYMM